MHVVIAGGHGQIALRLERLLAERGDTATGLIRRPEQAHDLESRGARAVVCDLEWTPVAELAEHLRGADAVVFAAGAGPASGSARKESVDRAAAVLLADAAGLAGVGRYLMISTMGLDRADDPATDPEFAAYLRAKAVAEDELRHRDLAWTILRPGRLTDDQGSGLIRLGAPPLPMGSVPRDDVAQVLLALLDTPSSTGRTLELTSGGGSVADALRAVLSAP
ncbi:SDR family oxidoreductase [Kitasatospora sp. NPDC056138]|uniref:SDR family oxidoreductase n=1 Tax=Kitasatospora sp. NPDC056138 TaxID=3345724 RepID=UPI0035D6B0A6